MKKTILALIALSLVNALQADESMEEEFKSRFLAFIASEDLSMDVLNQVWIYGDIPTKEYISAQRSLELAITKGIESIELVDIYPMMKKKLSEPVTLEGGTYTINLEPYKMMEITHEKKIKGASSGWSYLVGKSEGKLYLVGYKKQ